MSPWSKATRDNWFFLALATSVVALILLFSPYLYDILFAAVLVVVSWPLHQRMLGWCGGRRALASVSTLIVLAVVVFVPVGIVLGLALQDALTLAQRGIAFVQEGTLQEYVTRVAALRDTPELAWARPILDRLLPPGQDVLATVAGPLQQGALAAFNAVGSSLPALVQGTVDIGIQAIIFLFTAATLYMEGPRLLVVFKNLSPMDDAYEERLFSVFREFANNIVFGSLVTAALQGVVASLGYLIGGADRVIFLGILTAVLSFVPLLGAAGVGVGVGVYVGLTVGPGWGLFVVVWSLIVTGMVDNLIKPFLLRGQTDIHPLLIFLSVFGGLGWMGVPGLLVGPVIVAFFLALYTIYKTEYLGIVDTPPQAPPAPIPPAEPPEAAPTVTVAPPPAAVGPQGAATAGASSGDGK